jgi:hypothetical protein
VEMTKCMNNLRQIGVGIQMYHDDHGQYPRDRVRNAANQLIRFHGAIGGGDGELLGKPGNEVIPMAHERPLRNYVKSPDAFRCVVDGGTAIDGKPAISNFRAYGCSYLYNFWVPALEREGQIASIAPNLLIVMYEPPAASVGGYGGSTWYFQWHLRKGEPVLSGAQVSKAARFVSPISFLDGHAASHDFTQAILYNADSSSKWRWK